MQRLLNKRIVLGITGSIAAYKSVELVRELREQGAEVRIVMTQDAQAFITPLTLGAISGNPVYTNNTAIADISTEWTMEHISLARWADRIVIAPATANTMARLAVGMANDLLTTLCLASQAALIIAPAMNQQMWHHSATQHNLQVLRDRGVRICGPTSGSQACGETGLGRMVEPASLAAFIAADFQPHALIGKRVVITAGPTREPIDGVRFISNPSSGKMGFALAEAAVERGAQVTLIAGPVSLSASAGIHRIDVVTADDMLAAVQEQMSTPCDLFIATAAVTDFKASLSTSQKIKKNELPHSLLIHLNQDILAYVAQLPNKPFLVGFAAETVHVKEYGREKLIQKNLDLLFANDVSEQHIGFQSNDNEGIALWHQGEKIFKRMSKRQLACELLDLIGERL